MAMDDVLKRVTEARVLEQIIQELQGMCLGMLADRTWLVLATYELWTGDKLGAAERLFDTGATDHQLEEWMLRNLQRLRAQHHQQAQERAQTAKSGALEGDDPRNVDNTVDRMEKDDAGLTDEPRVKKNPTELSKRNARKLRKRPGAIKRVRKLGQLPENQNDWEMDLPPWAHSVWEIILSMDKSGKQLLKDEARAERAKERQREKKARKKAKRQARKVAGKKTKGASDSSSSSSGSSSSDESSDSSSSSGRSTPRGRPFNRKSGSVSSGMPEFKIINGKCHFKAQSGKWVDWSTQQAM